MRRFFKVLCMTENQRPQIESRPESTHVVGERRIASSNVRIGTNAGRLYTLEKIDAGETPPPVANRAPGSEEMREARAILERAHSPLSEGEVLQFYSGEKPLGVEVDGEQFKVPFVGAELDQYLLHPERVSEMDFEVHAPFEIDPQLKPFKDRFIALERAAGRRLSDNDITGVGAYDSTRNVVGVRNARYFDIAVTNNLGLDVRFSEITEPITREGKTHETLRQVESPSGKLRPFSESLLANVLGIGGILITRDGQLVIPQRKAGAGVASLDGTYGLTASGNAEWDEQRLDEVGIQEHLGGKMRKEIKEELGIKARKRGMNLNRYLLNNMEAYVRREVGLDSAKGEVQITPLAFSRDLIRGGLPQMFYLFQTSLEAAEIPGRMAAATDARKEYNQVITLPFTPELVKNILGNRVEGMRFNQEMRAAVAQAWSVKQVRELAK